MAKRQSAKVQKITRNVKRDELAEELDLHSETVGRYDRMGAPYERRGRCNYYNVAEYRGWMQANINDSPDLEKARLRKENALAAKYELQVQRERGELIPVTDVKQWVGQHVTTAKNKLIGLGASVTPLLEGRDAAERQTLIDARVTEILNELAAA
jgi:hypothetical protein